MKRIVPYMIVAVFIAFVGLVQHASAQNVTSAAGTSLQERVEALAGDPALSQAVVGICVRTADGRTLVDINADMMMVPASNMKLITTGAALHQLGADYQYETALAYDGEIVDGVLYGNLYITGGGDPTTGSKDTIATPLEALFRQWEAMVREGGIRRIEGDIIGDGRWMDGMSEEPTWLWNDIGTYYGAGATGLMFYENMQSFSVSAGPDEGAPVNIRPYYPDAPWMTFIYDCSTGKAGTGDRLYMYASDMAPMAVIRGTFGVDRAAKRLDCANKFPEYTCAHYFRNYLENSGISCSGGVSDFRFVPAAGALQRGGLSASDLPESPESSSLPLLGSTASPNLGRIVYETNHASNNLFAETLLRTLGKEMNSSACYDSSYVALNNVLKSLGLDLSKGFRLQDGSGLSRQNYISPDFFCRFLTAMMDSPEYPTFLSSLPSPGGNGTLNYNMKSQPAALRNRIKVKSGSMNGVRCYSGYILPSAADNPDDILVFSIMTNNCTSPTWKVRPLLDRIMTALAQN